MSPSKLVTVCTIACNAEDTISRFFNWVYPRFENIVIITSESEDDTVEIVQYFASVRPDRFTHIHKEMSSFAAHKQLSLDAAPTKWKHIVDAYITFEFEKSKPVHEVRIGEGRGSNNHPHIVHWGHLRKEEDLKMKSIMRTKYAIWDRADGAQLLKSDNWFAERNEQWDEQIEKLPKSTYRLVKRHL